MFGSITFATDGFGAKPLPWRKIIGAGLETPAGAAAVAGAGGAKATGRTSAAAAGVASVPGVGIRVGRSPMSPGGRIDGHGQAIGVAGGAWTAAVAASLVSTALAQGSVVTVPQQGGINGVGMSIGMSRGPVAQEALLTAQAQAMSGTGSTILTAGAVLAVSASAGETVPLYVPNPPSMAPLEASHAADVLEAELKALFIEMFERFVRPDERYVNLMGMPQYGTRELIDASLANDGLSIYRGADAGGNAGSYLLRSWRAKNPKRGTHLLETYLQLLWPNVWTSRQMWMSKAPGAAYPADVVGEDGGNHFLTSRVNVTLPSSATTGGDVAAISSGLRASVPARVVLNIAIETVEDIGIGFAGVVSSGVVGQAFEGTTI
jgi:hypothetical protein